MMSVRWYMVFDWYLLPVFVTQVSIASSWQQRHRCFLRHRLQSKAFFFLGNFISIHLQAHLDDYGYQAKFWNVRYIQHLKNVIKHSKIIKCV